MKNLTILTVVAVTALISFQAGAVSVFDDAKVALAMDNGADGTLVSVGQVQDTNAPASDNTSIYGTPMWEAVPGIGNGMSIQLVKSEDDAVGFGNGANDEIKNMVNTMTMWTRARINSYDAQFGHIMLLGRREGNQFMAEIKVATDTYEGVEYTWLYPNIEVYGTGSSEAKAINEFHPVVGTYSLAPGQWFEYAFTYDENDAFGLRLYMRTDLAGAFSLVKFSGNVGALNLVDAGTLINRRSDSLNYYRGDQNMESMALWDRVLTLDDLNSISGAVPSIPEPASLTLIGLALAVFARKGRK